MVRIFRKESIMAVTDMREQEGGSYGVNCSQLNLNNKQCEDT